jgi:hypothetical protein
MGVEFVPAVIQIEPFQATPFTRDVVAQIVSVVATFVHDVPFALHFTEVKPPVALPTANHNCCLEFPLILTCPFTSNE